VSDLLAAARAEAVRLQHDYLGTEHLLLALIATGDPTLGTVLAPFSATPEALRERVEKRCPQGKGAPAAPEEIGLRSGARRALEQAKALANGSEPGGTQLLGALLLDGKGVVAASLGDLGIPVPKVREALGITPPPRPDRPERPEKAEKPEKAERSEATPVPPKAGRQERADRGPRPDKAERPRQERQPRPERVERTEGRPERGERSVREERRERGEESRNSADSRPKLPPVHDPFLTWRKLPLLAIPLALYFAWGGSFPPALVFGTACLAVLPLAGFMGEATEHLSARTGPTLGGFLNATFGNAAELIIAIAALRAGEVELVKASITGSIIGNLLLVLGAGIIVGGLRHGVQRFDSREAGRNATMLLMAIFGLVLPAVYANSDPDAIRIEEVSLVVAAALLVIYFAYIAYSFRAEGADPAIAKEMRVGAPDGHGEAMDEAPRASMSRTAALIMLGVATVATVVLSETLVGEVEAVVKTFGISEFFIGAIVVPLVGNVAEHFSAVTFASKNKLDITLGIAAGSSTQVALLVAPALVFLSLFLGPAPRSLANGMNLVFLPLEIVAVTASGLLFNYISNDGETNWLEGVQLVSLYLIIAAIFFLLQMPVATGH